MTRSGLLLVGALAVAILFLDRRLRRLELVAPRRALVSEQGWRSQDRVA